VKAARLLALMLRESRGASGRLLFFVACLAVGVAAVVAVAGLSGSLEEGVRVRARELLAADLVVRSRRALPEALDGLLTEAGVAGRTPVIEVDTLVAGPATDGGPGKSRLVELKAVGGPYPFYGRLELLPDRPLHELLADDAVLCARELLAGLGLAVGDTLRVGGQPFRIVGEVVAEPDRLDISLTSGPRVFMSLDGLLRTSLLDLGSRVSHRMLVRLPDTSTNADVQALERSLHRALDETENLRIETHADAQPALRRGIDRVDSFLGLVALLSLLVGGIGVAQTVRAWIAGRTESIAVMACLGMTPRQLLALYLGHTLLLGLAGSVVGVALGVAAQLGLGTLLDADGLLPAGLARPWQPLAMLRGLLLGVGVALLFGVAPLRVVLRVRPALVLRRDVGLRAGRRRNDVLVALLVGAGVFGAAWVQSGELLYASAFTAGLCVTAGLLALAAGGLVRAAARLPRERLALTLRHGVAALARPGAGTRGAILALGLGVAVVLGMQLVHARLAHELTSALPADAPTEFLIDIQPDQWPGVQGLLAEQGAAAVDSVPVVVARLTSIDGVPVEQLAGPRRGREGDAGDAGDGRAAEGREADLRARERSGARDGGRDGGRDGEARTGRSRWVLTREQRLTWREVLADDNRIVAGALWSDPEQKEVSLEERYAEDLGVGLGARLVFDVQGVPVELRVTSLRDVSWESFRINFFLVVEPGVLEQAPHVRLAAAQLPADGGQRLQDALAADYPNVSVIRVAEILERVRAALDSIGLGVRLLGGFTVCAGLAILAGAVSAGALRRRREVALLKTLGMTRRQVALAHGTEHALVGAVAGLLGAAGGTALAYGVVTVVLELQWTGAGAVPALAVAGAAALATLAGLAASLRPLAVSPSAVLRSE
jgi:putative ABC transport system permease protein